MLPLEHLKRKNLGMGKSQTPAKKFQSENQKTFREQIFSFSQDALEAEVSNLLDFHKDIIRTKLEMTMKENDEILTRIHHHDEAIESLFQKKLGSLLSTLKDEISAVLVNHFRSELYNHLAKQHCRNVFNFRAKKYADQFPIPIKTSTPLCYQTEKSGKSYKLI